MKRFHIMVLILALLSHTGLLLAQPGFVDHFDDGLLDPAWNVSFQDAYGWTYGESGTELTVTNLVPAVVNPGGGGTWSHIFLTRGFDGPGDIDLAFDFSWDSEGDDAAMQVVYVQLLDAEGNRVVTCGYHDPWGRERGEMSVWVQDDDPWSYGSGYGTLPYAGDAFVEIQRLDGLVTISWDNAPLLTAPLQSTIHSVRLDFGFYAKDNEHGPSFFGSESINLISVVPEPATMSLLALGGLAILRRQKK